MQCTGLLCRLQSTDSRQFGSICIEEEGWIEILVRIVKGISLEHSITRNTYTIGFSSLMLPAVLRCKSPLLGFEIQKWLEMLRSLHPTEEGAFPVYQTLGVVKAVNQQRMIGREILGVTLPKDDAGGNPKFTAYNSQSISPLVLHGRCLASGTLLTECVSIES
ncbi:hypothetical protein BJY04DRAFT_184449 [Aspergillus karnatakaensis]|uniref:uncharacterized protein n=1 Tax=Aspergillus karnatakaensis TaxID=1810916 RepID=UPI003CCE2B55